MNIQQDALSEAKRLVLDRIDIFAKCKAAGMRPSGTKPNKDGWFEFYSVDRDEQHPSAAVNVGTNGHRGQYTDRGSGDRAISFWDLMVKLGLFPTWYAALQCFAAETAVELPKPSQRKASKGRDGLAIEQLAFFGEAVTIEDGIRTATKITECYSTRLMFEEFARSKVGVTVDAIVAAGGLVANWPDTKPQRFENEKLTVLAFPGYTPSNWTTPTAWVLYRPCGQSFPAIPNTSLRDRKVHELAGSKKSLVVVGGETTLETAHTVWLCEGIPDALTLSGHLSTGHVAVACMGAGDISDSLVPAFAGKIVYIVGDADTAGVKGASTAAAMMLPVAQEVKIVRLPFEVTKAHGRDLRDYFNEGRTFNELQSIIDAAPTFTQADIKAAVPTVSDMSSGDGPREYSLWNDDGKTELANAARFATRFMDVVRWCDPWDKWLIWDGRRWEVDRRRKVETLAKQLATELWQELSKASDHSESEIKMVTGFIKGTSQANGLKHMLSLARSEPGIPIVPEMLDQDHYALNIENGTLDLRTGTLRPHHRMDFITKLAPVRFDVDAECPIFRQFVGQIMDNNLELIGYLRRLMGVSLSGDVSAQVLPFFYGTGANGKTTLLNAWLQVLGTDYAMRGASDLLMARVGDQHPTERADLFGKRLVVCSEIEQGRRLNESLIKDLTGGDSIRARRMKENFWEFKPTHKLIVCGNHKPVVRGTDHGIWRRLKLLPFVISTPPERQDRLLPTKLEAETSGILNWMLLGLREWLDKGLGEPEGVTAATAGYRSEQDVLGQFITELCIIADWAKVKGQTLYKLYSDWCNGSGEHAINVRAFGIALAERGFERYTNNGTWYRGITHSETRID